MCRTAQAIIAKTALMAEVTPDIAFTAINNDTVVGSDKVKAYFERMLTGFTADSDRWRGKIYDPESGKTYRSEVNREGAVLKVKGCISFFCRTQTWTRVE